MISFQLQLEVFHHKVLNPVDVCIRECPHFHLVDARFEASQDQNELNLVVDMPIK